MRVFRFNRRIVKPSRGLLVAVSAGIVCAISGGISAADLTVKPRLCITDSEQKSCELPLEFTWRTDKNGNYCLVQHANEQQLQCWQQNKQGQWQATQSVTDQELFWLTEDGQALPLAQATVEVLSTYTEDRRRNRRRKHVWSLM